VATGASATGIGTITSLPAGSYVVYLADANGCTNTVNYQILVNPTLATISFASTSSVTCNGGSDGSALAIPPPSFSANPTYSWSPGAYTTPLVNGLSAGIIYTVTIADAKGCVSSATISVTEPPPIISTLASTFITCYGKKLNTTITSTGNIGTTNYTVNGIAASQNNAVNLGVGVQTIVTMDSKGCFKTNTVMVTQEIQPILSFNISKPSCPGKADGGVVSGVTDAPSPLTYTWFPGNSNNPNLSNIPTGTYTLSVLDGNGCVTTSVTVVSPAVSATVNALTKPENCSASDGGFTLSVSGVSPPFTYTTIGIGPHASPSVNNISSGSYTTITSYNNNCIDTLVFDVGNLSTVVVNVLSIAPVLCYNNCTASLSIGVQNAVPPVTYSATGTPSTSSNIFTNLCAGFYVIRVVDANGCPGTTTVNLAAPPIFSYSATGPSITCAGRQVSLSGMASGGSGNYTFVWNPGGFYGQYVNLTPAGTTVYSLNVYDSNGCTQAPAQLTVNVRPQISVGVNSSGTGICPGTTTQITPTVTGGDGNYTYLWLPGNSTGASIFVENATVPTYTFIVNDGCGSPVVTKLVNINLFPLIKPTFSSRSKRGCAPLCTKFINTTPNSTSAVWSFGDSPITGQGDTTNYCYRYPGTFDLIMRVVDSNACTASFIYQEAIEVLAPPVADFKSIPTRITLKNAENVQIKNLSGMGLTFKWFVEGKSYGETEDLSYTFSDTGCYRFTLVAENSNRCSDTTDKYICVVEDFHFFMPNCFTPNDNNVNDILIPRGTGWTSTNYYFEIYNSWGKSVFKTQDISQGWDGSRAEDISPFNAYNWLVRITDTEGIIHHLSGHVTVLR